MRGECRVGGLRREHTTAYGCVRSFDFRDVEEPRRVSNESSAGKGAFRDRLKSPFIQSPRRVGDAFPTLEDRFVERMMFEFLKFSVGGQPWVGVVQPHDETHGDEIVPEMIHPATAVSGVRERVSHRVQHFTVAEIFRFDFPDFFQPQRICLRLAVSSQVEFLHDLFGQTPMAPFGEQSEPGMELHPSLKRRFRLSIATDTLIIGRHTLHGPIIGIVQHFTRGEPRINLYPQILRPFRKPLAELVQADDVISVVLRLWRDRHAYGLVLGQEAHFIINDRRCMFKSNRVQRRDPVRE